MFEKLNTEQRKWVERTFQALSEDEKIGQLVNERGTYVMNRDIPTAEWLKKYPVGSIFTGSEIIESFAAGAGMTASLQETVASAGLKVPVLYSGDFENGIGAQIDGYTVMPCTMGLSATFSEKDSYDFGKVIGSEGRALDIRWGFGPVADLNTNPNNPVTSIRSTGDEPDHALKILKNIVKGMQDQGMAACPKHFPGDGTDTRNQHFVTSFNVLSKAEWDQLHGRVFRELIEAGAMSIMIGHIAFPDYEPMDEKKQLWRPATCSRRIMIGLLRDELGFDGIILTDALCMYGYLAWGDYETRILDTFNGGADVFLWPAPEKFFPVMKAALRDGRISYERLDESVRRVLSFKALLGLMPEDNMPKADMSRLLKENHAIAQRIGENGITLLRNRDGLLPLKLKKGARILLFIAPDKAGPFKALRQFKKRLEQRGYEVTMAKTSDFYVLEKTIDVFDSVMFLSDANPQYSSEYHGFDNIIWDFMACEKIKRRIIISFATPYFLYEVAGAATYINAYHDCEASVDATVRAIFGEIPFKGTSPVGVKNCFSFGDGLTLRRHAWGKKS